MQDISAGSNLPSLKGSPACNWCQSAGTLRTNCIGKWRLVVLCAGGEVLGQAKTSMLMLDLLAFVARQKQCDASWALHPFSM